MWFAAAAGINVGWIPKPGDQKSAGCPEKLCGSGRAMGKSGMPAIKTNAEIKYNYRNYQLTWVMLINVLNYI
jgi:hypothetical protein